MSDQTYGQASAFTIEQIGGSADDVPVKVELRARALPYWPITIGGKMRAQTDWYPGNPEATVQFLGPEEDELTIHGMWKDRFIVGASVDNNGTKLPTAGVNGVQVNDAFSLVETFHRLRRAGRPVRITWDAIIREGFISHFAATYERREDIEWELTFTITSWGDVYAPAVISSQTDLTSATSAMLKTQNDLSTSVSTTPFQMVGDFAAKITQAISSLESSIDEFTSSVTAVNDAFLSASANARRIAGIAQGIADSADEIIDTISSQPPINAFFVPGAPVPSYGDTLVAQLWTSTLYGTARTAKRNALNQQRAFLLQVQPNLIGKFIAQDNLDLRTVSLSYYGTTEQWPALMQFNGLSSSGLVAGTLVLVPTLAAIGVDPASQGGA